MSYNANSIKILEGLEAVRLRPGMYIGSTGQKGLHHLINEIIDNSVDEHLSGYCNNIEVIYDKDNSITVIDDGRGIPVDMHEAGLPASRIIMTTLHAGGKFETGTGRISGGLHGVGAAVVNALSKYFKVEIHRENNIYVDEYEFGIPKTKLKNGLLPSIGKTNKNGTIIKFIPDDEIFDDVEFKPEKIKKRLKELSYLNKKLKLIFVDKVNDEKVEYENKDGLIAFMKDINESKDTITEIIELSGECDDGTEVDIVMQYTDDSAEMIHSYCNNINTQEGGTHVTGFRGALTRTINQYSRELNVLKDNDDNFEGRDIRNGVVAIISIRYPNPEFEGQTKTKLGNPEVRNIVDTVMSKQSQIYFDRNLSELEKIIKNTQKSLKLRTAEEKVRSNVMGKDNKLAVSKKLASCSSRDKNKNEIFLVEGDSAGGSAKQGRNRKYQAILPLKGKILNVEKQTLDRVLNSLEITTLISALGTNIGSEFDISKLKYGKIIIMTDADVDGSHINTLILTLFYRYMPELITNGNVFIAMPPLYKVTQGKRERYFYDDRELDKFMEQNKNKNISIQRYKGLGEMNPEQLWDTTLNPKTRTLKRVNIDDAMEADKTTRTLMGSKVPPRREFIYEYADNADIDV